MRKSFFIVDKNCVVAVGNSGAGLIPLQSLLLRHGQLVTCLHMRNQNQNLQQRISR